MLKRSFAVMALVFAALPAGAAPGEDMAASLIDAKGRYTIGPWSGVEQGNSCVLTNSEPLAGADLVISAVKGSASVNVTIGDQPVAVPGGLDELSRLPVLSLSGHSYDMHGFDLASALFKHCLSGQLPASLPDEPVEEGNPEAIAETNNWSVTHLTMGNYPYARLVTLDIGGAYGFGFWRHNGAEYLLNITSLGDFPPLADTSAVSVKVTPGNTVISLTATAQQGGILMSVTPAQLEVMARAQAISLQSGSFSADFDVSGINKAIPVLLGE